MGTCMTVLFAIPSGSLKFQQVLFPALRNLHRCTLLLGYPCLQITQPEDILVQNLRDIFRAVAPAMLVLLSWTYVGLANVNMVRVLLQLLEALAWIPWEIGLICVQRTS